MSILGAKLTIKEKMRIARFSLLNMETMLNGMQNTVARRMNPANQFRESKNVIGRRKTTESAM